MRYIRTEKKIYDVERIHKETIDAHSYYKDYEFEEPKPNPLFGELEFNYTCLEKSGDKDRHHFGFGIQCDLSKVRQSDNLTELLDEALIPPHDITRGFMTSEIHYVEGHEGDVYGAIWTDQGLIYVAKYEDKEWKVL